MVGPVGLAGNAHELKINLPECRVRSCPLNPVFWLGLLTALEWSCVTYLLGHDLKPGDNCTLALAGGSTKRQRLEQRSYRLSGAEGVSIGRGGCVKRFFAAIVVGFAVILSGCAAMQVERDLKNADDVARYLQALTVEAPVISAGNCDMEPRLGKWIELSFSAASPIVKLPTGVTAAAFCMLRPAEAELMKLRTYAAGGLTYFEMTIVHPAIMMLDANLNSVTDMPVPKFTVGESFWRGLGFTGSFALHEDPSRMKYAVVYIHPLSFVGFIEVDTGYETIPVLVGPYGNVEIRFE